MQIKLHYLIFLTKVFLIHGLHAEAETSQLSLPTGLYWCLDMPSKRNNYIGHYNLMLTCQLNITRRDYETLKLPNNIIM